MVSGSTNSINVAYFFHLIYDAFFGAHISNGTEVFFLTAWQIITIIGYIISIIALFVLVYSLMHLHEIRRQEKVLYGPLPTPSNAPIADPRWQHAQDLMESTNINDWRQAIIEADIMLGDMLTRQGYTGETLGEQLKQIEPSDFLTLNDAWEAHKIRNEIAHGGSAFILSEMLARRTIAHYGNVFREFKMI